MKTNQIRPEIIAALTNHSEPETARAIALHLGRSGVRLIANLCEEMVETGVMVTGPLYEGERTYRLAA